MDLLHAGKLMSTAEFVNAADHLRELAQKITGKACVEQEKTEGTRLKNVSGELLMRENSLVQPRTRMKE